MIREQVRPLVRVHTARPLLWQFDSLALFFNGLYTGFFYDFSKTDRTFQESTGQTIADDNDEVVGLALEESQWGGRTLAELIAAQPELAVNGGFGADTNWIKQAGWTIAGGVAVATATVNNLFQGVLASGRFYRTQYEVVAFTSGSVRNAVTGINGPTIAATGVQTAILGPSNGTNLVFDGVSSFTGTIDNASAKLIPGNHATQTTAGARPLRKTGGFLRFDGADDNLLTTLNPSAAFTMAFKGVITSASKLAMGSNAGADTRAYIGTDASGLLAAGVGAHDITTIVGGADIRTVRGVNVLTYDGTTVRLYRNGVQIYSGAQSGSPNTTIPVRLGANNNNGTAGSFADADIDRALAINRALTPSEVFQLTNLWGTS